jgi:NAD(P)-dependent dehydrogenase (short-subunit alcohol dehydrogenase family)
MSEGRVAFVTGAGSGIGRACAGELARRGYRIVVTDRTLDGARPTAVELDSAQAIELDVRDAA